MSTTPYHAEKSLYEARNDMELLLMTVDNIEDEDKVRAWVVDLSRVINRLQHLRKYVRGESDAYPDC